jgi:hypothetical protein
LLRLRWKNPEVQNHREAALDMPSRGVRRGEDPVYGQQDERRRPKFAYTNDNFSDFVSNDARR